MISRFSNTLIYRDNKTETGIGISFRRNVALFSISLVLFPFLLCPVLVLAAPQITNVEVKQNAGRTLLIVESNSPLEYEYFKLNNPSRTIVDISGLEQFGRLYEIFNGTLVAGSDPCIKNVKLKALANHEFRLMFSVKDGLLPSVYKAKTTSANHYRMVIDIYPENSQNNICEGVVASTDVKKDYKIQHNVDDSKLSEITDLGDTVFIPPEEVKKAKKKKGKSRLFKVSGFAMFDVLLRHVDGKAAEDPLLKFDETYELRRAKLNMGGILGDFRYVFGLDFVDLIKDQDDIDLYRAYIAYAPLKQAQFALGLQPEPFGLEKSSSSKYTLFMERSLTNTFAPEDNLGFLVASNINNRMDLQVGTFTERNYPEGGKVEKSYTGKLSAAPIAVNDKLLHFGASYSYRVPLEGKVRYSARPEAHLANRLFDSGKLRSVETVSIYGFEGALLLGSFSIQSEYVASNVEFNSETNSETYSAAYVSATWFVTGEMRSYAHGVFGRIKPKHPIHKKGWGAWQLAARVSNIKDQHQQELQDLTLGINWYLTKRNRVMFNWVFTRYETIDSYDDADIFMMRLQLGF